MLGSVLDTPLVNLPNIFWLLQFEFSVNQQRWMQIFLIVYKGHTEVSKWIGSSTISGQNVANKFTKLSKIGFNIECFTAGFVRVFNENVKI